MANGKFIKIQPSDILKHFAQRGDLRAMAYVHNSDLGKYVWVFDTNVFIDDVDYPKCEKIVMAGNFLVSMDVIDELTRGVPVPGVSQWQRARKLADYIVKHHPDKIFQKPNAQLVQELQKLSVIMSKGYVQKTVFDNLTSIYALFKSSKNQQDTLDKFIYAINDKMYQTLKNNFKSRAKGLVQESKINAIENYFIENMKAALKAIFHSLMNYASLDIEACKKYLMRHFFRPINADVNIAASYIEHRKPHHHLGSNDKDVVELIILHEHRALA